MSRVASILRFVPAAESRNDGELLAAFRLHRDEAAFAELVRRHGPLVWGVCRRLLPDYADVEDAFQASFLVLVRRAKGLSDRATVGPWLYKVAAWTARNLRRKNARRLARRSPLADTIPVPPTVPDSRLDIDAALLALPEKYRAPLILCHLEGLSRRDAAERLGCAEGTLSSLLSRGLAKLRVRLAGHEFVLAAVPALLASSTVRAACATRLVVAASVNHLIEGVLHMLWVKKATAAMTALVVVFAAGMGVGVTARTATVAVAVDEKTKSGLTKSERETHLKQPDAPESEEYLKAYRMAIELKAALGSQESYLKHQQKAWEELDRDIKNTQASVAENRKQLAEVEKQRDDLAKRGFGLRPYVATPTGPLIEIVVAKPAVHPQFSIKEYGAGGKLVVTFATDDKDTLGVFFTRTSKDPTAPKSLRIVADAEALTETVQAVLVASKSAGFENSILMKR